jgi:hypothetical protein
MILLDNYLGSIGHDQYLPAMLPCSAGKAALVNTVVLGGSLVQCSGLVVSVLRKLKLLAFDESAKGGSYTFPVDIIQHSSLPIG